MKRIISLFICILCLSGCSSPEREIQGFSMDAPYQISGYDLSDVQIDETKQILRDADKRFNAFSDDSTLSVMNCQKKLVIDDDDSDEAILYRVVSSALPYCDEYFDISIRPVSKLWNFSSDISKIPDEKEVLENLKSVGFQNIVITENSIFLENGTELDLGAVAKGYVCDEIAACLNHNIALIDIGGTVKTVGKNITAGVKAPTLDGLLCSFTLPAGKAVATSGSYERFLESDGKIYHHILNPKTGFPFDSELLGVSVICSSAMEADILATKLFAMGRIDTKPENAEVIFVTKDMQVYVTDGVKDFKMLHNDYTLVNEKVE